MTHILCWLHLHKWTGWLYRFGQLGKEFRHCERCGILQMRTLGE